MKLLVATAHRSVIGGVETHLRALLPLLTKGGHDVALVTAHPHSSGTAAIDDLCPALPSWVASDPNDLLAVARFWSPQVVYTHGSLSSASDLALLSSFPTIAYAHDYSGMCISGNKCHGSPGWRPCARRLGPACLGMYFPRQCGGRSPVTALNLYRVNRQRQALLPRYHSLSVASRYMAREVSRNRVRAEQIIVNPYFPPTMSPDSNAPPLRSQTGRILFIGRLTAIKGWRSLLDAIPQTVSLLGHSLKLIVAGDGPDRDAFQEQAERRGIANEFLGWIGIEQRIAEMRAADVLVVPSVWPEPFGIVGIEAGCVGLPAVGYAVGGIQDWLTPAVSGELAPGDKPEPDEFAAALVRALADNAKWQRLRIGAWEMAQQFTPTAHLERLASALQSAVAGS